MKPSTICILILLGIMLLWWGNGLAAGNPAIQTEEGTSSGLLGSAFAYQDRLQNASGPVNGACAEPGR
jgi:hypothetical protein